MWQLIYLLFTRRYLHQFATSAANLELGFHTSISYHSCYLPFNLKEVVSNPAKRHQSVVLAFYFVDDLKSTCRELLYFVFIHTKPTKWADFSLVLLYLHIWLLLSSDRVVLKLLSQVLNEALRLIVGQATLDKVPLLDCFNQVFSLRSQG